MSPRPVRLQLSRRKGFDLQKLSRETNGLPAVNCARPSEFGNPFVIGEVPLGGQTGGLPVADAREAVALFRRELLASLLRSNKSIDALIGLRGKNLACWCGLDAPCHCDVLLEIANRPLVCEEVTL
jgi:hypothetical protein